VEFCARRQQDAAMRSLFVVTLIWLLAGFSAASAQVPPKLDSAEFFRDLTERRAAAHIAGDRAFYEKLLSAEFVMMGDNGAITKKNEYLDVEFAGERTQGMKPFYSIGDFRMVTLRKDFAVVSYLKTEGMKLGEQTFSADARRIDTYALESGQWRLVTMVASRVLKPLKPISLPPEILAGYVGKYSIAPGVDSEIMVAGDHLAEQTTGQSATVLMPLGFDTFFDPDDSPAARTIFRRDASGKVIAWSYVNGDQEVIARKSN
jgi:hypothetical protein